MPGAPHGVGLLITMDFNAGYLATENKNEKRERESTDNFGGSWRYLYDKENETEFQAGYYYRAS